MLDWIDKPGQAEPDEIRLLSFIDRFGAEAVFGRNPAGGTLLRLITFENLAAAYREFRKTEDKGHWADQHPIMMAMILEVMEARTHGR